MQIGVVGSYQNHRSGERYKVTTGTIKTEKSGDTYDVHYRGMPSGKLLPYRLSMMGVLLCGGLAHTFVDDPVKNMIFTGLAALFTFYTVFGYVFYGFFAGFSGVVSFNPKEKSTAYKNKLFGISVGSGKIPWEDKLKVDLEPVGLEVKALPFCCYKLKLVTQFMTYHVATFGPKQTELAKEFAKAMVKARRGIMPKKSAAV